MGSKSVTYNVLGFREQYFSALLRIAALRFRGVKGDCVLIRLPVAKLETTNIAHPHLLLQAEFAVYLRTVLGWLMLLCRRVQNRMT